MKKSLFLSFVFLMLFALAATPVLAETYETAETSQHAAVEVTVEYGLPLIVPSISAPVDSADGLVEDFVPFRSRPVHNLGNNGSVNLNISNFRASSTRYTNNDYNTNSTRIRVNMTSDVSIQVRVILYNASSGAEVGRETVNVGTTFNTRVTFSNLTSSNNYYISFENLGSRDVNITGTITA